MTTAGFPHSETLGSTFGCQLPEDYRRLQRPSSAPDAKASTMRPYTLDHHTPPTTNTQATMQHQCGRTKTQTTKTQKKSTRRTPLHDARVHCAVLNQQPDIPPTTPPPDTHPPKEVNRCGERGRTPTRKTNPSQAGPSGPNSAPSIPHSKPPAVHTHPHPPRKGADPSRQYWLQQSH